MKAKYFSKCQTHMGGFKRFAISNTEYFQRLVSDTIYNTKYQYSICKHETS